VLKHSASSRVSPLWLTVDALVEVSGGDGRRAARDLVDAVRLAPRDEEQERRAREPRHERDGRAQKPARFTGPRPTSSLRTPPREVRALDLSEGREAPAAVLLVVEVEALAARLHARGDGREVGHRARGVRVVVRAVGVVDDVVGRVINRDERAARALRVPRARGRSLFLRVGLVRLPHHVAEPQFRDDRTYRARFAAVARRVEDGRGDEKRRAVGHVLDGRAQHLRRLQIPYADFVCGLGRREIFRVFQMKVDALLIPVGAKEHVARAVEARYLLQIFAIVTEERGEVLAHRVGDVRLRGVGGVLLRVANVGGERVALREFDEARVLLVEYAHDLSPDARGALRGAFAQQSLDRADAAAVVDCAQHEQRREPEGREDEYDLCSECHGVKGLRRASGETRRATDGLRVAPSITDR
jgi:hypothetical protein